MEQNEIDRLGKLIRVTAKPMDDKDNVAGQETGREPSRAAGDGQPDVSSAAPAAPASSAGITTWWLIEEVIEDGLTFYWTGLDFSPDALEAVRFKDKKRCREAVDILMEFWKMPIELLKPREHQFYDSEAARQLNAARAENEALRKVVNAAKVLAPLLEEGWDEYDATEDQEAGTKACDDLVAAVAALSDREK